VRVNKQCQAGYNNMVKLYNFKYLNVIDKHSVNVKIVCNITKGRYNNNNKYMK